MRKPLALVLFALPALVAAPAWAQGPAQGQRPNLPPVPTYEVQRAKSAPVIDGALNDAAWAAARPVTFVFPWENQTGAKQTTTARLAWDSTHLYVAYECADSDITAQHTERDDPTYRDDAVEIFIAPPGVKNLYVGLEMNVRAVLYDYVYPFPQRIMKHYNLPGVRLVTAMRGTLNASGDQDQGWSLEVAIPWAAFADLTNNPVPKPGDRWIANLNRWDGTPPNRRLSQWSDSGQMRADPHWPDRFGQLVFAE